MRRARNEAPRRVRIGDRNCRSNWLRAGKLPRRSRAAADPGKRRCTPGARRLRQPVSAVV